MPMKGFGVQPFGTSPYGLGTPATAPVETGGLLRDPLTGDSHGARRIDPNARDYVCDENGRILGMSQAQQLVILAVSMDLGSSAMQSLGNELRSIERITSNLVYRVRSTVTEAMQHIVDQGFMEILDITAVQIAPGKVRGRILWLDLSTSRPIERTTEF